MYQILLNNSFSSESVMKLVSKRKCEGLMMNEVSNPIKYFFRSDSLMNLVS